MALLVTVGSTSFDALIQEINSSDFAVYAKEAGIRQVVVQYGRGLVEPDWRYLHAKDIKSKEIECRSLRFTPSLGAELQAADYVISHAGAGTVLEALALRKRLIVVVNDQLMDNHQTELAQQMEADGFLYQTTCRKLMDTLRSAKWESVRPLPGGNAAQFASAMEAWMGV